MKIFLINPACLDIRITDDDAAAVPIGLYYIAAEMIERGFETEIINLALLQQKNFASNQDKDILSIQSQQSKNSRNIYVEYLTNIVKSKKPDIIGFSVLNANRHSAIEGAAAVKKIYPDTRIIFGGPAPTFIPQYFFNVCPALDYIVKGEGEKSFSELVSYIENNSKASVSKSSANDQHSQISEKNGSDNSKMPDYIKGIVFSNNGNTVETAKREPISNLDTLPHPAKYFTFQHIALSRGCIGRCTFCGSPDFWGKGRVRFHSAKWFVDEMELLIQKGISHFFVSDDTFTMKKELVIEVCGEIIKRFVNRGIKITWAAISRVDFIDEDILFYMRLAGCIQISFGVESGSEEIRKTLGKHFKNENIIKAFKMTKSFGIMPRAYFIYGSLGETSHTIQKSIQLIEQIEPLSMVSYMLVIFPGTAIYRNLIAPKDETSLWDQPIEDIPWFEIDPNLDFNQVKKFGELLRSTFYSNVQRFALNTTLVDKKELYPYHADFLSRLAMTFSHGDYSANSNIGHLQSSRNINKHNLQDQDNTAKILYERALQYYPDARSYLGLAMLMQKKRDFQGAVDIIKHALKSIPQIHSKEQISDKHQFVLCIAVSLMNMAKFSEALEYLEPFKSYEDVKPYIDACRSRL